MRKKLTLPVLLIAVIIVLLSDYNFNNNTAPMPADTYKVVRIVDGDTFIITYNGKNQSVRLIGVDTPESVKPNSPVEYYGKEASDYTKSLIEGKNIRLEFDVEDRDKYNRLLAYVYLEDGRMLNEVLIGEGYAQLMTVPPNVKYSEKFVSLQKEARKEKKGLWNKK